MKGRSNALLRGSSRKHPAHPLTLAAVARHYPSWVTLNLKPSIAPLGRPLVGFLLGPKGGVP